MNRQTPVSRLLVHFQTPCLHIAVVGLGAVGGVYAAALLDGLKGDTRVKVSFLVTDRQLTMLRKNGLLLVTRETTRVYHPTQIVSRAEEISAPVHILIMAVKGCQLGSATTQWRDVLADKAWVVSLLNGVGNGIFLQNNLPSKRILDGCVYVGAHFVAPGQVFWEGGPRRLFFGDMVEKPDHLPSLAVLFRQGGVDASVVHPIGEAIWEKFSFVSPVAVVTSLFGCSLVDIDRDAEKRELFLALTEELMTLGRADGKVLAGLTPESSAGKLTLFDEQTTSSLYRDLSQGQAGEFGVLVDDVLRMARGHNLVLPAYSRCAERLHAMYGWI